MLAGLTSPILASVLNDLIAAQRVVDYDFTGITINVDETVLFPATTRSISGGSWVRAAGLGATDWMIQVGTADMGSSNTRLNTLTAATITGAVSAGATSITHGSVIDPGWYVVYGDSSTGDAITHSDGSFTHYCRAELVYVTGYSGGDIQLRSPLTRPYTTCKLSPWTPMTNLVISDMVINGFDGASAGCSTCLAVGPTINLQVQGCTFSGYSSSAFKTCLSRNVTVLNCNMHTDSSVLSGRYGLEFGRCTGVFAKNINGGVGRWLLTGQGIYLGVGEDCYGEYGMDAMDHGCFGDQVTLRRCAKKQDGTGAFNIGNSSYYGGTTNVTLVDCDIRSGAPASVDEVVYIYPNSSVRFQDCLLHQLKSQTFAPGLSGLVGDQGPTSITVGSGTIIERGTYGTHATATGPGGGDVIQFSYGGTPYAAGSKLGTFTLEAGAHMKSCTFAAPIRAEGLVGACTFNISGGLWVQWVSASVPCILVNNGNHTINLNTGFIMGNTQGTQPSATFDAVRVNAGVSGCTINRGANVSLKWSSGASSTTITPMGTDRVNDVSGLATIV